MPCAAARRRGRASASISNTCRRVCGRSRRHSIPTTTRRSASRASLPENLRELGGGRDLELVVAAVGRPLVGTPAHEGRRVTEAIALQVVVLHLAHALDPEGLPRQILAGAPTALAAGHANVAVADVRPLAPRVRVERVL